MKPLLIQKMDPADGRVLAEVLLPSGKTATITGDQITQLVTCGVPLYQIDPDGEPMLFVMSEGDEPDLVRVPFKLPPNTVVSVEDIAAMTELFAELRGQEQLRIARTGASKLLPKTKFTRENLGSADWWQALNQEQVYVLEHVTPRDCSFSRPQPHIKAALGHKYSRATRNLTYFVAHFKPGLGQGGSCA